MTDFICPKCSCAHRWHIDLNAAQIALMQHYDGGVWCRACRDRWAQIARMRRAYDERMHHMGKCGLMRWTSLNYRLPQSRLPL